jgi:hypothetical protein
VQEVAHEGAGRGLGELGGETDHQHHRDPHLFEQRLLLAQGGDRRRRLLGAQHRQRMWIEGDHHGGHLQLAGALHRAVEHGALAAVHAVEVADGGDAAARQLATVVGVVEDVHGTREGQA